MNESRPRPLAAILALVWLVVVVSAYYVTHKPFSLEIASGLGIALARVAVALGWVSAGGAVGSALLPEWELGRLERMALRAAAGLGALGIFFHLFGMVVGLSGWLVGLALAGIIVLRWRAWLAWWTDAGDLTRVLRESGVVGWAIAAGIGTILLATLTLALAPPLRFDALVYHLTLPRLFLQDARIEFAPGNVFWGMPQTGETLFLLGMALAGESAAAAIGWAIGAIAILGALGTGARLFDSTTGWVSAAALMSGATLSRSLAWGYVDWLVLLFGWAFLVCLIGWRAQHTSHSILWAGVFAGLAVGTKYTAGLLAPAGALVIWWDHRGREEWPWKPMLRFAMGAGLASLFWWGRNFLATGNPLYPLLFPTEWMDPIRLAFYQSHTPWGDWRDVVLLPWRATQVGVEGGPGYGASIGPLLLGLIGLALVGRFEEPGKITSGVSTSALVGVVGLAIWAIAARTSALLNQTRLYFAVFPALVVLAGAGYRAIARARLPQVRLSRVVGILVVFVLWLNVLHTGVEVVRGGALPVVIGIESERTYLEANLGWYAWSMESLRDLPGEARVLMLWEPRGFYCLPVCDSDEVLDRWVHAMRSLGDPEAVLEAWRGAGFTHVLYHRVGARFIQDDDPRYLPSEWDRLEAFLASLPLQESYGGVYELYRLEP